MKIATPPPQQQPLKLRCLTSRGRHVHFSDELHHVKYFHFDEAPSAVQQALVCVSNDNIGEGHAVRAKRTSLPSQSFASSRPSKYTRTG